MKKILSVFLTLTLTFTSSFVALAFPTAAPISFVMDGNGEGICTSKAYSEDQLTDEEKAKTYESYVLYDSLGNVIHYGDGVPWMDNPLAYSLGDVRLQSDRYTIKTLMDKVDENYNVIETITRGPDLNLDITVDPIPVAYDSIQLVANSDGRGGNQAIIKGTFDANSFYYATLMSEESPLCFSAYIYTDENTLTIDVPIDLGVIDTIVLQRFSNSEIISPTSAKTTVTETLKISIAEIP